MFRRSIISDLQQEDGISQKCTHTHTNSFKIYLQVFKEKIFQLTNTSMKY
uniref:Uncharacterized protein n=1 Tax=Arion vulgaris TaxID=1028688 RepID=A0A0B7B0L1_9EUPU